MGFFFKPPNIGGFRSRFFLKPKDRKFLEKHWAGGNVMNWRSMELI